MRARIAVTMINAAFDPPRPELARILRDLADRVEAGTGESLTGGRWLLKDVNGNRVGSMIVEETGRAELHPGGER